jgi:amino acid transporter
MAYGVALLVALALGYSVLSRVSLPSSGGYYDAAPTAYDDESYDE